MQQPSAEKTGQAEEREKRPAEGPLIGLLRRSGCSLLVEVEVCQNFLISFCACVFVNY